ncbi:MAG: CARDB domain-containing protein [Candidatus Micrarchaeaceae archaeon]
MKQIKERYMWAAFFIVVIALSLYFRIYYQAPISLNISMPSYASTQIYPYQLVSIPITISNTGSSSFSNLTFGLYINGNVSTVYKASIPESKQVTMHFNFTPKTTGNYIISFVADPSKLYNIINRRSSRANTTIMVSPQQAAEPYIHFNKGAQGADTFELNPIGYAVSTFLVNNFSATRFSLTTSTNVDNFIYPAVDVYMSYIKKIAVAHAYYANYSLASIWLSGYITPDSLDQVAIGKGINVTLYRNVSLIKLGNNTTACSWYSGGWTKVLISILGNSCLSYLNKTFAFNYSGLYKTLNNKNTSILNYSGYISNLTYSGDILYENKTFLYQSLMQGGKGVNFSNTCYGNILNISNTSYCSTNLISGNFMLSKVTKLVGNYNISAWALTNTSDIEQGNSYALGLAEAYNLTGNKTVFVSAFINKCYLEASLPCKSPGFNYNNITIPFSNDFNKTVTINSLGCFLAGKYTPAKPDLSVASGKSANMSTTCYNNGVPLSGTIPLGLQFSLILNYTLGGKTTTSQGYAYIAK